MSEPSVEATEKASSPVCRLGDMDTGPDGDDSFFFDWNPFVPQLVHPMKVAIVEALAYMEQPLSASELKRLFGDVRYISNVSYHLEELSQIGAVMPEEEQQVGGSTKKPFRLSLQRGVCFQ